MIEETNVCRIQTIGDAMSNEIDDFLIREHIPNAIAGHDYEFIIVGFFFNDYIRVR